MQVYVPNNFKVGSIIAGYLSDKALIKSARRRGGAWIPEDRLHEAFLGSLLLVSPSILFSGLVLEYVKGTPGFVLNLVCLFINGFGVSYICLRNNRNSL